MNNKLILSPLQHTWIFDVDGTLVKHNGYLIDGYDTLLNSVKETFDKIPQEDTIILLTAREDKYIGDLKKFLKENNIRFDYLLSNIPTGERILINDIKPKTNLITAYSINKKRDDKLSINFKIDKEK